MSPDNSDIGTSIFPVVKVLRIIPEDQKMAKTALPAGISAFGVLAYSPHEMSIRRIGDPRSAIRSYNSMTEGIITRPNWYPWEGMRFLSRGCLDRYGNILHEVRQRFSKNPLRDNGSKVYLDRIFHPNSL